MPTPILMPALSPTMTEGTIARWVKQPGQAVKPGDVIAEIETDKATMEVEAVDEGVLGKILVAEGTAGVEVNKVIALLLAEGEDASALDQAAAPAAKPATIPAAANAAATAAASTTVPAAAATTTTIAATAVSRIFASPLAKRIAQQMGVDLNSVRGTGPHGRILKADVETAASTPQPTKAAAATSKTTPAISADGMPEYTLQPHTTMRKVIAKRLSESKQTVPHFYLSVDITLDALLTLRQQVNAALGDKGKLTVNDFLIKASGLALTQVPAANASWSDEGVKLYQSADVSVAVAIEGGLITPIIRNAQSKSLSDISQEMKQLAAKARDGKLQPHEFQGGTFSISNLGMFGIKSFSAIVNPPQGCILAVGAGEQRAVVKDGALAVATVMTCTLSVDHRVVDGAVGAQYLSTLKTLLENPLAMLV